MKYLILCDLHLSEKTEETVFSILTYAYRLLECKKTDKIAIIGDLWDTVYKDGFVDARLQKRLYLFFKHYFKPKEVCLLSGNHDKYGGFVDNTALTVFDSVATVYDIPTLDGSILWLPYKAEGYSSTYINTQRRKGCKYCFTHNDFKYLETRRASLSDTGMDPSIFRDILVFNGHYHYHNQHENVICVGSQYAVHSTETFDQKWLFTVDIDNNDVVKKKIRFGKREFRISMEYCRDLAEEYWKPYVNGEVKDIPPSYPCVQDMLYITCEEDDTDTSFLKNIVECGIVTYEEDLEKQITSPEVDILHDDNNACFRKVIKCMYKGEDNDTFRSGLLKDITEEYKVFCKQNYETEISRTLSHVTFQTMHIENFSGVTSATVQFKSGITTVVGKNGCGKTVTYPTSFLYVLSGVTDTRFSEERMLVADIRTDGGEASVTMKGSINTTPFEICRKHNGKKSRLMFKYDGKEIKGTTVKQIQHEICKRIFNVKVCKNTCPHRYAYKLLLRRAIWKQGGGKDSSIVTLSKDSLQQLLFDIFEKSHFVSFMKFLKQRVKKLNENEIEKQQEYDNIVTVVEEREKASLTENTSLRAWQIHRKESLEKLKHELQSLQNNPVSCPLEYNHEEIDKYTEYKTNINCLKSKILTLVQSKEGLRWDPEYCITSLQTAQDDKKVIYQELENIYTEQGMVQTCIDIVREINENLFDAVVRLMEGNDLNILLGQKKRTLKDGRKMKYLSGGQYENECLMCFLAYNKFIKNNAYWSSNVIIFDEPGTAMSSSLLQTFVNQLPQEKACFVITHKDIKSKNQITF